MSTPAFFCFGIAAIAIFLLVEAPAILAVLAGAGTGALCSYFWVQDGPLLAIGAFVGCVLLVGMLASGGRGGRGGGGGGDWADALGDVIGSALD